MSEGPIKIFLLAESSDQFREAEQGFKQLAPAGSKVIRIQSPNQLRGLRDIRIVALPSWQRNFHFAECNLIRLLAKTYQISIYELTRLKYRRLLAEVAASVEAIILLNSESKGGDYPDS